MTLNKNKNKKFNKYTNNVNSPTSNDDKSKHFSSANNINNNNIKRKAPKEK